MYQLAVTYMYFFETGHQDSPVPFLKWRHKVHMYILRPHKFAAIFLLVWTLLKGRLILKFSFGIIFDQNTNENFNGVLP